MNEILVTTFTSSILEAGSSEIGDQFPDLRRHDCVVVR